MASPQPVNPEFEREKWLAEIKAERAKWRAEIKFREREIALKEREQARAEEEVKFRDRETAVKEKEVKLKEDDAWLSRLTNPLTLAIFSVALAGLVNAGLSTLNNRHQMQLEDKKSTATLALEDKKSSATLALEDKKLTGTLRLEENKAEATRIIEMIKARDPDGAAENLKFLVESGLIANDLLSQKIQKFLKERKPGTGPFQPIGLPVERASTTMSCNRASARLVAPSGYSVSVTEENDQCLFSVNGASDSDQVVRCQSGLAYVPRDVTVSMAESGGRCSIYVAGAAAN